MKKKLLLVLVLAALVAGGAFAFDISAGGGVSISNQFGGGVGVGNFKEEFPWFGFGVFGYFDATYVEASLGLTFAFGKINDDLFYDVSIDTNYTILNLSILGKYPISLGDGMTVFPAAGIDYQMVLSMSSNGVSWTDANEYMSALWFKFGVGLDYDLDDSMYLRFLGLYGLRLQNKYESETISALFNIPNYNMGHGFTLKAAVGFRF
ncbi:MAG: hypothetical protein FWD28_10755 [Treponema sp.]|nr:hypothetical protein [Treponema sp.]